MTKYCNICKQDKDTSGFSFNKSSKDKLQYTCKECLKKYQKQYHKKNKKNKPEEQIPTHKKCTGCKKTKAFNAFAKLKRGKHGKQAKCKECSNALAKEHREKDLERYKLSSLKHRKRNVAYKMLKNAKSRAKAKGLECSISEEHIIIPDICPILEIAIFSSRTGIPGPKDNSPTLDRIDNSIGYVPGNVQVISCKANQMKNNGSFEDIEKLYFFMKKQEKA